MILLTDVLAKSHDLGVNFYGGDIDARAALEYSRHPRILPKIERGLPDHILTSPTADFYMNVQVVCRNSKRDPSFVPSVVMVPLSGCNHLRAQTAAQRQGCGIKKMAGLA
jgi:hypothetical protein